MQPTSTDESISKLGEAVSSKHNMQIVVQRNDLLSWQLVLKFWALAVVWVVVLVVIRSRMRKSFKVKVN